MFIFMTEHTSVIIADIMTVLFITSLFAALQAFHNAVARYLYSLGREGVVSHQFSHTNRAGAPWAGSLAQTVIALVIVAGFALVGDAFGAAESMFGEQSVLFPVLTMFTWLTNTGAAGLVLLMSLTAFAVIGFFRKQPSSLSAWTTVIAPAVSGLLLAVMFLAILGNFPLMLGQEQPDLTTFILPGLIIVALIFGIVWALILRSNKPHLYAQIGHGTEPGAYGTEAIAIVGDSLAIRAEQLKPL